MADPPDRTSVINLDLYMSAQWQFRRVASGWDKETL